MHYIHNVLEPKKKKKTHCKHARTHTRLHISEVSIRRNITHMIFPDIIVRYMGLPRHNEYKFYFRNFF
jgi:hypothetical protein